jgi:dihydrolipoamide dehydrogenase
MEKFDLIIIGSGPGGYVAAIRAAQLGMQTAVFEKKDVGGVCLNVGCIPTKSLIKSAETVNSLKKAEEHGIEIPDFNLNYEKAHSRSRKIAQNLSKGISFLFKKHNITLIQDQALFDSANSVVAKGSGKKFQADNIIISTGSSSKQIPGFETDGITILNSTDLLLQNRTPKSMIILGAGAIGVEFAYVMNAFGVEVTLIELLDSILPLEDRESAKVVEREFKKKKIKVYTGAKASDCKKSQSSVELKVERNGNQEILDAEQLLLAVGRSPNSQGLELEKAGVDRDSRGFIKVNNDFQTTAKNIYAIGDVIDTPLLAHVASHEGIYTVEKIGGKSPQPLDYSAVPSCTYCNPQLASFGPTEEALKEKGIDYKSGTFNLKASGKAAILGENNGQVKILSDAKTGEVIAAHIVAPEASELVHELLIAKTGKLTAGQVGTTMHAHPTLAESIMEAALNVDGKAIHG